MGRGWLARCVIAAVLCAGAGCLEAPVTQCGELLCGDDRVCDPSGTRCVLPEQLTPCVGMADGTLCEVGGAQGFHCEGGVCVGGVCGDGFRDHDEVCDDGNTISGDGCKFDCSSDESCGNGDVDLGSGEECDDGNTEGGDCFGASCLIEFCGYYIIDPGEECDDGNFTPGDTCGPTCKIEACGNSFLDPQEQCDDGGLLDHDGCSSRCAVEIPGWRQVTFDTPPARRNHVIAHHAASGKTVMVSGFGSSGPETYWPDAWVLEGGWWSEITTGVPPGRDDSAMVYDSARQRLVLFGGFQRNATSFVKSNDTWVFDGATWTQLAISDPPPERTRHGMAYDSARDRVVLYGGIGLSDTWELVGDQWMQMSPSSSPGERSAFGMAYDPVRGVTVLFGGTGDLDETWEWNGSDWTQYIGASPPGRSFPLMAFDPSRGAIVMTGGQNGVATRSDTWVYDASGWTQITTTPSPLPRAQCQMAYDPAVGGLVLFGGLDDNPSLRDDTWVLDGNEWRSITAPGQPTARDRSLMVFDQGAGRALMFGSGITDREAWAWDGAIWTREPSLDLPLLNARMVYDSNRGRVVSQFRIGQTWELVSGSWGQVATTTEPPSSSDAVMVWDTARARAVMYFTDFGSFSDAVYEYDGSDWAAVSTVDRPSRRRNAAMAFDEARGVTVLFGGTDAGSVDKLADTWEYDGTNWVDRTPPTGPTPRSNVMITYDPRRQRVVMFGGSSAAPLNEMWEWDGTLWVEQPSTAVARNRGTMAYDRVRGELVVFGGFALGSLNSDTWIHAFDDGRPGDVCLPGTDADQDGAMLCADPDCGAYCSSCGDATCDALEDCRRCPADCGACPIACGDHSCNGSETSSSCPGDCPP